MAMRYYAPFPGGGANPVRPRGLHALRIGDAERDAAAADLGEHYAAGRLTLDELHERLEAVFAAKTYGQLREVLADLPWSARLAGLNGLSGRPGGMARRDRPAGAAGPYQSGFRPIDQDRSTPADRAGRFAALSLLILAMLIWLFTALLFAKHGFQQVGPPMPMGHMGHYHFPPG